MAEQLALDGGESRLVGEIRIAESDEKERDASDCHRLEEFGC